MADPQTSNQLLFVPTRGSDPGTWDTPMNSNTTSVDGLFGGFQNISVSNASFSLTAPAGTVTASAGPTQAQNAILNFTGTLTANVQITLPLPGYYIIRNATVPGSFVLSFKAVNSGNVIGMPPGQMQHVFNDGTNVYFANLGNIGTVEIWAGLTAMPSWVAACTVPPYLLCDGSTFLIATYPIIGGRFGTVFGGNGVTTSATPDSRGRVPLIYDGTGTRITVGGCGINGQTLGASRDQQTITLGTANLPPYTPSGSVTTTIIVTPAGNSFMVSGSGNNVGVGGTNTGGALQAPPTASSTFLGNPEGGTSTPVNNVQPSIVTGIAVIRAA